MVICYVHTVLLLEFNWTDGMVDRYLRRYLQLSLMLAKYENIPKAGFNTAVGAILKNCGALFIEAKPFRPDVRQVSKTRSVGGARRR